MPSAIVLLLLALIVPGCAPLSVVVKPLQYRGRVLPGSSDEARSILEAAGLSSPAIPAYLSGAGLPAFVFVDASEGLHLIYPEKDVCADVTYTALPVANGIVERSPIPPEVVARLPRPVRRRLFSQRYGSSSRDAASALAPGSTDCSSPPNSPVVVAAYLAEVRESTLELWKPRRDIAASRPVTLRFVLRPDGSIQESGEAASARDALAASALSALRRAAPFPPVPPEASCLAGASIKATFRFDATQRASR